MDKVIFYCKKCGATYGGFPNEGDKKCSDCGSGLVVTNFPVSQWRELSDEQKEEKKKEFSTLQFSNYVGNTTASGESNIGSIIKMVSLIVGALSLLGALMMLQYINFAIVFSLALVDGLVVLLCYGIGEICSLLNSINNKL